jgi:endonuclease/exonuclease/phosphatase family metal-dependent hydrolase
MSDVKLKVMTFNIHHGKGTDRKLNLERVIALIKESKADVIGLNEVDKHFSRRSDYCDQVSYLAKHLHMYPAFGATFTLKSKQSSNLRQFGNALLSRFPIVSKKNHLIDFYAGIIEGRSLLDVTLQIKQKQLNVFVTHLSLNPILHRKQTDFILKKMLSKHLPVIVLGDWNMKPKKATWEKVNSLLTDVSEIAGKNVLYTFPSDRPKSKLDYIFVSDHFHVVSTNVIDNIPAASDHLPLIATLILNNSAT